MLSCFNIKFHTPSCFKPVESSKAAKIGKPVSLDKIQVDEVEQNSLIATAIEHIAAGSSKFIHQIIPTSPTAQARLKSAHNTNSSLVYENMVIEDMRESMLECFERELNSNKNNSREKALVTAYSEYAEMIIVNEMGNCAEKAMLAGMLIKAHIKSYLTMQGFTEQEIEKANLQLSIVGTSKENDHTVCLLSYVINESGKRHVIIVDPWINGSICHLNKANEFYGDNLINSNEQLTFDKVYEDRTFVVNNEECVSNVMRIMVRKHIIDFNPLHPFNNNNLL